MQNDFLWTVLLSWLWRQFTSDGGYQVWQSTVELHTGFLKLRWQCPDLLECNPGPDTTAFHILLLFSHLVMSNSLWPHGLQHARLPCLSVSLRVRSNSCPLHQWYLPTSVAPPFSSCPQSFPASGGQSISNELALCIRWPKYRSFSFCISPPNEYSVLIFFRIDWFDIHAVQGTIKNLFQHHSSKASILQCSAFFMVQLSNPYMITGKVIALTIQTTVGKVMVHLSSFVMQHAQPGYKSIADTTSSWYPAQNGDALLTPGKSWGPPGSGGWWDSIHTEQPLGSRHCIRVLFFFSSWLSLSPCEVNTFSHFIVRKLKLWDV